MSGNWSDTEDRQTGMKRPTTPSYLTDICIVVLVWAGFLLALAAAGWFGWGTGLGVATMGEDQNWVELLRLGDAQATAHRFWLIDSRNPLSPWIYLLAKPLILTFAYGLAWLQWIVGLVLAISSYLLLRRILGRRGRWFSVATACGIAVNFSNAYFDHIVWNFQMALCCSLLAVVAYWRFNQTQRTQVGLYGLSLGLWAIAFQIYTVQSGAIVAIALCHMRFWWQRHLPGGWRRMPAYVGSALADLLPFALLYGLFALVWTTTTVGGGFGYAFSAARLAASLGQGVFHDDTPLMVAVLALSPFAGRYLAIAAAFALVTAWLLQLAFGRAARLGNPLADYVFLMLVMAALALPTVLLESGGAGWPPGSRWRMIYQVTSPVLATSAAALLLAWHPWLRRRAGIAFALLMFGWLTGALAFNERQARLTQSEALVRGAIRGALDARAAAPRPLLAIIELDDSFRWFAGEAMQGVYMRTWFPGESVEMRLLPSPIYRSLARPDPLRFTPTGVAWDDADHARSYGYADVVVVRAFDRQVAVQTELSRSDVTGHHGEWQADSETIALPARPSSSPLKTF
jgi:hypothetical protein